MQKIISCSLLLVVIITVLLTQAGAVYAIENPLAVPTNKFGIHILDENDLKDAQLLVNSQGGDWGYVTIVIRQDERDADRWQKAFDEMRRKHLIPIVRLATIQGEGHWEKFEQEETQSWINFLGSLNWVVKNRYVIIGNEPNHAKEWGGEINPVEYAEQTLFLANALKSVSEDFFILPAGLDASAPNDKEHMSEDKFLQTIADEKPEFFDKIDGWNSHSYPNPAFSGSELDTGRGSIRTFEWEQELLRELGINKAYPIFVTETGWAHDRDQRVLGLKTPDVVSDKFVYAFQNAWSDEDIVAVTPFILNYHSEPFNVFSWKKEDGSYFDFYHAVQNLNKPQGRPIQLSLGEVIASLTPRLLKRDDERYSLVFAKNIGQSIWEKDKSQEVEIIVDGNKTMLDVIPAFSNIEPKHRGFVFVKPTGTL